jgi:uncharacterized damage-inducible protein DinB
MISPVHAQLMARYNRWQNRSLYGAADQLSDAQRKLDRGAFFGSIHGTLCHLVFGDLVWLFRFTGDEAFRPPATSLKESASAIAEWDELKAKRVEFDERLIAWTDQLTAADLEGVLSWHSGAVGREVSRPRWELITHVFNHQTHHRGQVHCLLTQCGLKPEDTDIPFMPTG